MKRIVVLSITLISFIFAAEKCVPTLDNTSLNIGVKKFECYEGIDGGYGECRLGVNYSETSFCEHMFRITFNCEAKLSYTDIRNFTQTQTLNKSEESYVNGFSFNTLEFKFFISSFDPIVQAKLKSLECSIASIDNFIK